MAECGHEVCLSRFIISELWEYENPLCMWFSFGGINPRKERNNTLGDLNITSSSSSSQLINPSNK